MCFVVLYNLHPSRWSRLVLEPAFFKPQFPSVKWRDIAILPTLDDIFSNLQGCRHQSGKVDGDPGVGVGLWRPPPCARG